MIFNLLFVALLSSNGPGSDSISSRSSSRDTLASIRDDPEYRNPTHIVRASRSYECKDEEAFAQEVLDSALQNFDQFQPDPTRDRRNRPLRGYVMTENYKV